MSNTSYDAAIIGGGIVGCTVAIYLKKYIDKVLILERENNILQRASYANQARVHNGYHYPRSFLTALRSRVDSQRFINEFQDCIFKSFNTYYGIAKYLSRINAEQFKNFCKRINAPIDQASKDIKRLFNPDLIEDVFLVEEYAFDAEKLRSRLISDIRRKEIELNTNVNVLKIERTANNMLQLVCQTGKITKGILAKHVFNCTYSYTNQILSESDIKTIPLKHELAELALVEVPSFLQNIGITIMCGPFFSIMPFPPLGVHTLSHVRYTPHYSWLETSNSNISKSEILIEKDKFTSNFPSMIKDAQRYIPSLNECRYIDSIWEIKTVLPRSEFDDSRPILFKKDHGLINFACILGGKIDNIYDIFDEIDTLILRGV